MKRMCMDGLDMTLRNLIHDIINLPDSMELSQLNDDPTDQTEVITCDGKIVTGVWLRGDGKIIIDVSDEKYL